MTLMNRDAIAVARVETRGGGAKADLTVAWTRTSLSTERIRSRSWCCRALLVANKALAGDNRCNGCGAHGAIEPAVSLGAAGRTNGRVSGERKTLTRQSFKIKELLRGQRIQSR